MHYDVWNSQNIVLAHIIKLKNYHRNSCIVNNYTITVLSQTCQFSNCSHDIYPIAHSKYCWSSLLRDVNLHFYPCISIWLWMTPLYQSNVHMVTVVELWEKSVTWIERGIGDEAAEGISKNEQITSNLLFLLRPRLADIYWSSNIFVKIDLEFIVCIFHVIFV